MKTASASISKRIMGRARSKGRGSVFTPADFLDLGTRDGIDQSLSRLVKAGQLRRLARGLYDFPRVHTKLGLLAPNPDKVAQALARETRSAVQIAGARAANVLGLSTQVPAKDTYLTDGPSRRIVLGKRVVDLRHAVSKHLIAPGSAAGTIVQALRYVGPSRAGDVVRAAAASLSSKDRQILQKSAVQAPAWMRPTLASIATAKPRATDG